MKYAISWYTRLSLTPPSIIACALQSHCNIIPVFDNFAMPDPQELPSTMREITRHNGVKWIHDYQDACVDKIARFIGGINSNSFT